MINKNKEVKKTSKKIVDNAQELAEIREKLLLMSKGLTTFSNHVADDMGGIYSQNEDLQKSLNKKFRCLAYALTANVIIVSIILLSILLKG